MSALRVEALTVQRGRRRVVDGVSFELAPGEVLVVVGPNGAGKTSLLEGVLGFVPAEGTVRHGDGPLASLAQRSRVFSYAPDAGEPPAEVTVAEILRQAARHGGLPPAAVDALAAALGLPPLVDARGAELSRGEKQRVQLFSALCTARPVIVLDEPLAAFDPLQLIEVLAALRDRAAAGAALLLTAHQLSDAEKIARRVLILDHGRALACGSLEALRAEARLPGASLEDVFLHLLRRARARA